MIAVATVFKIDHEQGTRLAREVAPILKSCGATAVRWGLRHSGEHTGKPMMVSLYPDWQTYGRACQAMYEDKAWMSALLQVMQAGEILDRSITVLEDL